MSSDAAKNETSDDQRILSGKRRAPRRSRSVGVRCIGPTGRAFLGRTVDISRGGVLIDITDPDFQPLEESADILPFAARVASHFPQGMDVNFGDGAVQTHANIIRLISKPGRAAGMLLGCKFVPPLTDFDCRLLGIDPGTDETTEPAAPIAEAPRAARKPEPIPALEVAEEPDEIEAAKAEILADSRPLLLGTEQFDEVSAADLEDWEEEVPETPPAPKARVYALDEKGRSVLKRPAPPAAAAAAAAPKKVPPAKDTRTAIERAMVNPPVPEIQRADRPRPGSRQPAMATWASEGTVVAHLFPANAPLHGPRFMGKLTHLRVRTALIELPAPDDEDDAAAWAASLGVTLRVVCVRDGRVLWETRARVMHVCASETDGWARATLLAVHTPPLHTRRMLGLVPATV